MAVRPGGGGGWERRTSGGRTRPGSALSPSPVQTRRQPRCPLSVPWAPPRGGLPRSAFPSPPLTPSHFPDLFSSFFWFLFCFFLVFVFYFFPCPISGSLSTETHFYVSVFVLVLCLLFPFPLHPSGGPAISLASRVLTLLPFILSPMILQALSSVLSSH